MFTIAARRTTCIFSARRFLSSLLRNPIRGQRHSGNKLPISLVETVQADTFPSLNPSETSSPKTFFGIQALRGLAAVAVVIHHGQQAIQDYSLGSIFDLGGGASGVDIFFAISGFIMVYTTAKFWGKAGAWSNFLTKRLIRIVPLYWIFTLLKVGGIMAGGGIVRYSVLTLPLVVGSFLFIPVYNPGHSQIVPILVVGWTLCYEMFFYLLLTICLAITKKPIQLLILVLCLLVAVSFFRQPSWGAQSTLINLILLEFVFGMVVALVVRAGHLLPAPVAAITALAMLALMIASPYIPFFSLPGHGDSDYRAFYWGIPGALILYATVSLEPFARRWFSGLPVLLGDASYSIYLVHAFVLAPVGAIWAHFHWLNSAWAWALVATGVVVSCVSGTIVHWIVEKPLIDFLHKKLIPAREAKAA
jgi:exopolysaccharide production protein ExoZ